MAATAIRQDPVGAQGQNRYGTEITNVQVSRAGLIMYLKDPGMVEAMVERATIDRKS